MELAVDTNIVPHPIFAEATSIEHFIELLQGYHAELMSTRPLEQRYELQLTQPRFEFHPANDPDYCSDVAWGEYHFKMKFIMPQRQGLPFETARKDFPFLQVLSSCGTGGSGVTKDAEETHGVSHDLECFPKLQAEFDVLQELNARHAQHEKQLGTLVEQTCADTAELQQLQAELATHRAAVYRLEAAEKVLKDRIATSVSQAHPDPYALERAALLNKFKAN